MKQVVESAPQLLNFLGEASMAHLNGLRSILDANDLAYTINPRLVRGMDYYNLTVFEFITESLGSQGTICGGGRYDYLIEQIGGKPSPAVGWGLGIERLLELVNEHNEPVAALVPDVYAIIPDAASLPLAIRVIETLRMAGIAVQMHAAAGEGMGSMKSQFKKADNSGAAYGLIFGGDELALGQVTVKSLRDGVGAQRLENLATVAQWAQTLQSTH
jgi:histidyl-tRNA synthetase